MINADKLWYSTRDETNDVYIATFKLGRVYSLPETQKKCKLYVISFSPNVGHPILSPKRMF